MNPDARITELERKIAYLENFIYELNEVIIEQDRRIKTLSKETDDIRKRIAEGSETSPGDEKPPHY